MKKLGITEGEWEVRNNKIFVKNTLNSIAIVCVQKNFDMTQFKAVEDTEAIANARLIAAAPDLLGALEQAQKLVAISRKYMPKSIKNSDKFDFENISANCINKAIKKAKGENNESN